MLLPRREQGETIHATHEANPGEVWEENEFWAALTWRIDPDGSLGIRKHFESPYRPGEPVTQEIAISVKGDRVECSINGTMVAGYDKPAVVTAGK